MALDHGQCCLYALTLERSGRRAWRRRCSGRQRQERGCGRTAARAQSHGHAHTPRGLYQGTNWPCKAGQHAQRSGLQLLSLGGGKALCMGHARLVVCHAGVAGLPQARRMRLLRNLRPKILGHGEGAWGGEGRLGSAVWPAGGSAGCCGEGSARVLARRTRLLHGRC